MTAILPSEVTEIVQKTDWVSGGFSVLGKQQGRFDYSFVQRSGGGLSRGLWWGGRVHDKACHAIIIHH